MVAMVAIVAVVAVATMAVDMGMLLIRWALGGLRSEKVMLRPIRKAEAGVFSFHCGRRID